jgi:hypothetical protein
MFHLPQLILWRDQISQTLRFWIRVSVESHVLQSYLRLDIPTSTDPDFIRQFSHINSSPEYLSYGLFSSLFGFFGIITMLISQVLVLITVLKSEKLLYQMVAVIALVESIFSGLQRRVNRKKTGGFPYHDSEELYWLKL